MNNGILESLLDSGAVTESKVLFALHKTGLFDIATLIKEAVDNIKVQVKDMTNQEAITELRKTAQYLEAMASIIEDIDAGIVLEDENVRAPVINVVGGEV